MARLTRIPTKCSMGRIMDEYGKWAISAPRQAYRFAGIAEDMLRLDQLLTEVRGLISWPRASESVTVINLACGRADETGVLWKHFFSPHRAAWYYGCDLRKAEILEARSRWRPSQGCEWQLEFRVADASQAHSLPRHGVADVVFIRHQNFWDAPAIWERIFRNAIRLLHAEGRLVITSYFDREHELALACLKALGAGLLADVPHHSSRSLSDAPGKSVDRRIAVLSGEGDYAFTPFPAKMLAGL